MTSPEKLSSVLSSAMKAAQRTAAEATKAVVKAGAETATSATQKVASVVADPSILADLVIASTAAQEKVNAILQQRKSIYRIGEVQITLALPPEVTFAISRVGDPDASSSADLLENPDDRA